MPDKNDTTETETSLLRDLRYDEVESLFVSGDLEKQLGSVMPSTSGGFHWSTTTGNHGGILPTRDEAVLALMEIVDDAGVDHPTRDRFQEVPVAAIRLAVGAVGKIEATFDELDAARTVSEWLTEVGGERL